MLGPENVQFDQIKNGQLIANIYFMRNTWKTVTGI